MTRSCNFTCNYCYYQHDSSPVQNPLPAETIRSFLDATGQEWTIGLTGGEPFLYPDFVQLCESLTEQHRIALDTNLSLSKPLQEFVERISPERVQDVYASLHIEEREKRGGIDPFIRNVQLLKNHGFVVKVNYVLHPTLIDRYQRDADTFAKYDIELAPRPFKGTYKGRDYPESYSQRAKNIFAKSSDGGKKMLFNFKGIPCNGGHSFIRMEPDGTIFRCAGEKTVLGQLPGEAELYDGPRPCNVSRCPCRGLDHVQLSTSQEYLVNALRYDLVDNIRPAEREYRKALEEDESNATAANNLGVIEWGNSRLQTAIKLFEHAYELCPGIQRFEQNLILSKSVLNGEPAFENPKKYSAVYAQANQTHS